MCALFWTEKGEKNYKTKKVPGITVINFGEWYEGYDAFKEHFKNCRHFGSKALRWCQVQETLRMIPCPTLLTRCMQEQGLFNHTDYYQIKFRSKYCWVNKDIYAGYDWFYYQLEAPYVKCVDPAFLYEMDIYPDYGRQTITIFNMRWNRVVSIDLRAWATRFFRYKMYPNMLARISRKHHVLKFKLVLEELSALPNSRSFRKAMKRCYDAASGLSLLSQSKSIKRRC